MSPRATRRIVGALVVAALAAVILLPALKRVVRNLTLPLSYAAVIREQAREKGLDPALVAAVIYAETKFVPRTSPTGAIGLMQIEPTTAVFLARRSGGTSFHVSDLSQPEINIRYGSYYLRYLLDQYGGNELLALAAYNGGATNADRWLARAQAAGVPFAARFIRFPQTRAYVQRVERAKADYAKTYGL